ncbi:competence protein [Flavobacterium sp.]|uniref:competence protein n=1 Tax=Flavobacterium sp. TaxID=239 RepID=UPI0028BEEAAD|nr:competence protein [Flavobacterium sp.]
MPFDHLKENTEELQEKLKNVVDSNVAYYKLWLFKVATKSTVTTLKILLVGLFLTLFLLFASVAFAMFLSDIFQSYSLGFLAVSGIYLLLALLIYLLKDTLFEKSILEKFSKIFFNE